MSIATASEGDNDKDDDNEGAAAAGGAAFDFKCSVGNASGNVRSARDFVISETSCASSDCDAPRSIASDN